MEPPTLYVIGLEETIDSETVDASWVDRQEANMGL